VLLGLLIGSGLALLSIMLIEPLIENLTKQPHDVKVVAGVRGNWKALLSWIVLVWGVVAVGEEVIYRGFLMSLIVKLLGTSSLALLLNVLITSIIFGLSHAYQGRSGPWSTGIIGACLGILYILSGFNLWLPILVHGVIDTVALIVISRGADKRLREFLWKKPQQVEG
jgi:membrane protease YdiL (CAAX protease family)